MQLAQPAVHETGLRASGGQVFNGGQGPFPSSRAYTPLRGDVHHHVDDLALRKLPSTLAWQGVASRFCFLPFERPPPVGTVSVGALTR